jgi:hypothetical protein
LTAAAKRLAIGCDGSEAAENIVANVVEAGLATEPVNVAAAGATTS